jgi:hypothetical protein
VGGRSVVADDLAELPLARPPDEPRRDEKRDQQSRQRRQSNAGRDIAKDVEERDLIAKQQGKMK